MTLLEQTAVHEAGHAVAACELEMLYDGASIVRNAEAGTLGHVPVADDEFAPGAPEAKVAAWAENHAVVDYAGHAAIVVLLGIGDMSEESAFEHGASMDMENASAVCGGNESMMRRARDRAVEIVTRRRDDVRKVADALLKRNRLSAQQIDWILGWEEPIPEWLD